tara:strand:- start:113 stop:679 length:567 start_codon:yes stop_codon:yes gene_type:complete
VKVSRQQVAENRSQILDAAARMIREEGLNGISVAKVMQAAGLTHGGFYGYFGSKDDLVTATLDHIHGVNGTNSSADITNLADYATEYLSRTHRDNPGLGCAFAAIGCEVGRSSADSRAVLTDATRRQIEKLSTVTDNKTAEPAERRREAIGNWSAMVGAVMLARLVDDTELSDEILNETLHWITSKPK